MSNSEPTSLLEFLKSEDSDLLFWNQKWLDAEPLTLDTNVYHDMFKRDYEDADLNSK